MLTRKHSIHGRFMMAFSAFTTIMLFAALGISTAWFFHYERQEMREALLVDAAIVAAQSSAAVMFNDVQAMTENLEVLHHVKAVRWAILVADGKRLTHYGQVPEDLYSLQRELRENGGVIEHLDRIVLSQNIVYDDITRGELLLGADLTELNVQFGAVVLFGVLLVAVFMFIALPVFHHIVGTISGPLGELARLSQLISTHGDQGIRVRIPYQDEVGRLGAAFNSMLDSLAQRDQSLRKSRDQLRALNAHQQAIREEERTRIAHEIHDDLGQRLTALKLEIARHLGERNGSMDPEALKIGCMVDDTVKAVREISWDLRPSVLDTLGLTAAIEWLGEDFQRRMATRCRVTVPTQELRVDPEVATHLFRICQELLTNVARHAQASRVEIRLEAAQRLTLEVSDNGIGIQASSRGEKSLGLLGIRERTHRLGGVVTIDSTPEFQGTRVRVTTPYILPAEANLLPSNGDSP